MIAIVDYGVGNLFSLQCSLKKAGADTIVTADIATIRQADKIILPGVGAFADAVQKLRDSGLAEVVIAEAQRGKPIMGICLGMQMLFEKSYEYGEHEGLGLLKGKILPIRGAVRDDLKVPHIGWNALRFVKEHPLFVNTKEGEFVYFVHSFYADGCEDSLVAVTDYGKELTAAVAKGNIMGCQFHPEKSGEAGLQILRAFCAL